MENGELACAETEVIESGELIFGVHLRYDGFQFLGVPEHDCAEIEVIAERALLIVNDRCFGDEPLVVCLCTWYLVPSYFMKPVRIDHCSAGHLHHLNHPFLPQVDPFDVGLEANHRVLG